MNNAGIDKVKIILNPMFLNSNYERHIRADNALTIHEFGCLTYLSIHAEYFQPFLEYRSSIVMAICELIEKRLFISQ